MGAGNGQVLTSPNIQTRDDHVKYQVCMNVKLEKFGNVCMYVLGIQLMIL
eukprot:COSAG01_NODE_40167_length_466_cov_137.220708_1_plen_49_part_10